MNPQICAILETCMFFPPSHSKSGKVSWIPPIELLDHVSIELGRFYTPKLPLVDQWERWNSNFVDFTFLKIERPFLNQNLSGWNRNTSRKYHVHYTQEFSRWCLVELLIFCKEMHCTRNTEVGHLAYSYTWKPSSMVDCVWCSIEPKFISRFRNLVLWGTFAVETSIAPLVTNWRSQNLASGSMYDIQLC